MTCASVTYKGSTKVFFKSLAEQLDIPTEAVSFNDECEDGGKPLTVDELKEEILSNLTHDTLIILPEAKRLPASVRYWLEDAISAERNSVGTASGARIVCFSPVNLGRDIFLSLLEVELEFAGRSQHSRGDGAGSQEVRVVA